MTCGGGSRTQTRTCTNPIPQGSGADCVGSPTNTGSCNLVACPGKCIVMSVLVCVLFTLHFTLIINC